MISDYVRRFGANLAASANSSPRFFDAKKEKKKNADQKPGER